MRDPLSKIKSLDDICAEVRAAKKNGHRVGTTNGCFDILHWGHIQYLAEARRLVDVLVVLLNTDDSVRKLKGDGRPVQNQDARLKQMAGLESVDFVGLFSESTPEAALSRIQPSVHFKGGDYRVDDLPETKVVRAGGGDVRCLALAPGFSTTALIARILESESH